MVSYHFPFKGVSLAINEILFSNNHGFTFGRFPPKQVSLPKLIMLAKLIAKFVSNGQATSS